MVQYVLFSMVFGSDGLFFFFLQIKNKTSINLCTLEKAHIIVFVTHFIFTQNPKVLQIKTIRNVK